MKNTILFKKNFLKKTIAERQLIVAKIQRNLEGNLPKKLYSHTKAYHNLNGLLKIAIDNRNKEATMLGEDSYNECEGMGVIISIMGFGEVKGRVCGYDTKDDTLIISVTKLEEGKTIPYEELNDTTFIRPKSRKHKKGFLYINQKMTV